MSPRNIRPQVTSNNSKEKIQMKPDCSTISLHCSTLKPPPKKKRKITNMLKDTEYIKCGLQFFSTCFCELIWLCIILFILANVINEKSSLRFPVYSLKLCNLWPGGRTTGKDLSSLAYLHKTQQNRMVYFLSPLPNYT